MTEAANGADGGAANLPQQKETINCPSNLVGKLIGRKGETIQTLEHRTGARIQVDHQKEGDTKQITISSTNPQEIEDAKAFIKEVLYNESFNINEQSVEMECPTDKVGRIIGRQGETIKSLQRFTNAKVQVDQSVEPRKISITGKLDSVHFAAKMVRDLIDEEKPYVQDILQRHIKGVTREVKCPRNMVGKVIGQKGETIKRVQSERGVIIKIHQDVEPCVITIFGTREHVQAAEEDILMLINQRPGGPGMPYEGPRGRGFGPRGPGGYPGGGY